jgi:hypothetical protein
MAEIPYQDILQAPRVSTTPALEPPAPSPWLINWHNATDFGTCDLRDAQGDFNSDNASESSVELETEYLDLTGLHPRPVTRSENRGSESPEKQTLDIQRLDRVSSSCGRSDTRMSTGSNWSRESILGPSSNASILDVIMVEGLAKELNSLDVPFNQNEKRRSSSLKAQLEKLDDLVEVAEPRSPVAPKRLKNATRRSLLSEGIAAARIQEHTRGPAKSLIDREGSHVVLSTEPTHIQEPSAVVTSNVNAQESSRSLECPWIACSAKFPGMNRLKYVVSPVNRSDQLTLLDNTRRENIWSHTSVPCAEKDTIVPR